MLLLQDQFRDEDRVEELTSLSVEQGKDGDGTFNITLGYVPRGFSEIRETFSIGVEF